MKKRKNHIVKDQPIFHRKNSTIFRGDRMHNKLVADMHSGTNARFNHKIFNCWSFNQFISDYDFGFEIIVWFCNTTQLTWLNDNIGLMLEWVIIWVIYYESHVMSHSYKWQWWVIWGTYTNIFWFDRSARTDTSSDINFSIWIFGICFDEFSDIFVDAITGQDWLKFYHVGHSLAWSWAA